MSQLIMFSGKNTPLKRYKSYFPMFDLIDGNSQHEIKHDRVLCHSLGITHALNVCTALHHNMTIICMDGVNIYDLTVPDCVKIITFRPIQREGENDEHQFHKIIYYDLPENIRHYPYQNKVIRDQIVQLLI